MPVRAATANRQRMFLSYFYGHVGEADIRETIRIVAEGAAGPGPYHSLAVFEPGIDYSEIDLAALDRIHTVAAQAFRERGIVRGRNAAAVASAADPRLVLPLWNALCSIRGAEDCAYTLFPGVADALAFLGVPAAEEPALMALIRPR